MKTQCTSWPTKMEDSENSAHVILASIHFIKVGHQRLFKRIAIKAWSRSLTRS